MEATNTKVVNVAVKVYQDSGFFLVKLNEEMGWQIARVHLNEKGILNPLIGPITVEFAGDAQEYLAMHLKDICEILLPHTPDQYMLLNESNNIK